MISVSLPTFEERVAAIEQEARRLVVALNDQLEAQVPSCPGWSGRDLVQHLAQVFTFFAHQLASGDPSGRHEPPEAEEGAVAEPLEWLDAATDVLAESLADLGPGEPCWNWSGTDLSSSWVARRMALEATVHRYDGELATGSATPVAVGLAVDGIDERIDVHLRCDVPDSPAVALGGPLCLACTDTDAAWIVEVGNGKLRCRHGTGPAAAVVRGEASQLFLFTWNRVPLADLELTGDHAVAAAWSRLPV